MLLGHHAVTNCPALYIAAHLGDFAGEFVADHDRRHVGMLIVLDLEVAAADATGTHPDQHFIRPDLRDGDLAKLQMSWAVLCFDQSLHILSSLSTTRFPFTAIAVAAPR